MERSASKRPIPMYPSAEKSHESRSDPKKEGFEGGSPRLPGLARVTRGLQKLISNVYTEGFRSPPVETTGSGERKPPEIHQSPEQTIAPIDHVGVTPPPQI